MTKRRKKTVEPVFTLPGEDGLGVEIIGCSHGLNLLARRALEQLPTGKALPDAFISTMPVEQEDIDKMAREIAIVNLNIVGEELLQTRRNYIVNTTQRHLKRDTVSASMLSPTVI